MTDKDFDRACAMLRAVFPKVSYLDNDEGVDIFFNTLNRYETQDVMKGIRECVESCQYPPSIREVTDAIERSESNRLADERRRNNARETWSLAVKCTKCNDTGYIFVKHADGTEAVMPCQCAAGRARFPSLFATDEERQKWVEDERRKNRNPPTGKPGLSAEQMKEYCGEIVEMAPGRRPPAPPRKFEEKG